MRPSVLSRTVRADVSAFADDVEYYLSLTPRQLPSQYLYDDLGSALFEAICELPWYAITRVEQDLLARYAPAIFARLHPVTTLVELGPGSGRKLDTLVRGVNLSNELTVHLVDVSPAALETAVATLSHHRGLAIVTHQAAYEAGLDEVARTVTADGRALVLFLGSNIGNFDPPGAEEFLRSIRRSLADGDALLIGADLVKPKRDLMLAYDDPLGVTAAFNRNLLVRANRELGADFDIEHFAHRVVWNADESRVEMHLVATVPQRVRIPGSRLDIRFEQDETIWTESSYKYRPGDIVGMLERAGFGLIEQWLDASSTFALTLVEAR